jgi:hypothetical protein
VSAGKQTSEFLVSIAAKYNRPELLEIGNKAFDSSGNTLQKFHGAMFDDAKAKITEAKARQSSALHTKQLQEFKKKNDAQFNTLLGDTTLLVDKAEQTDDPADTSAAFDGITESMNRLRNAAESGDFEGNEAHFVNQMRMLKVQESLVIKSDGIPAMEEKLAGMLATGKFDLDTYNTIQHGLSSKTKSAVRGVVNEELRNINAADAQFRTLEAKAHNFERLEPAVLAGKSWATWLSNPINEQAVEAAASNGNIPDLDPKVMVAEVQRSHEKLIRSRLKEAREGGPSFVLPTSDELREVSQPIVDKYQKRADDFMRSLSTTQADIQNKQKEQILKSGLTLDDKEADRLTKVLAKAEHDNVLFDKDLTFNDIDDVDRLAEIGKASPKAVKESLIAEMRKGRIRPHKQFLLEGENPKPSELLSHVASKLSFDLRNVNDIETLADLIEKGAADYSITAEFTDGGGLGPKSKRSLSLINPSQRKFTTKLGPVLANYLRSSEYPLWSEEGQKDFFKSYGSNLPKDEKQELKLVFDNIFKTEREFEKKRAADQLKRIKALENQEGVPPVQDFPSE